MQLKEGWQKISVKAGSLKDQQRQTFKRTILATIVISTISTSTSIATAKETAKLQKVYHVYINNNYLGTVSDKEKVRRFVNQKMSETQKRFEGYQLAYKKDDLAFVPEQVFTASVDNEKDVISKIQENYDVAVEAVAVQIDGKTVTYLTDEEKVNELIEKLKLTYIPPEQLKALETQSNENLPELKEGETRITDISLSTKLTYVYEEIDPAQVTSVDEAVNLLQKGIEKAGKYIVKEGDVLGTIAESHGLDLKQLLDLNPGLNEDSIIQIGDELNVTVYEPYVKVNVKQENMSLQKIPYEVQIVEDETMYKGDAKVVQEGVEGEKMVRSIITLQNGTKIGEEIADEKVIKEPVNKIIHQGTKVIPSRGTGQFAWPTNGGYISSHLGYRWGKQHKGIDIARPEDRIIKSADNGTVVSAGWDGGYGNKIVIDHNNGIQTVYAHLSSINVSIGQTVEKGSQIGIMGSTGNSTGIHLHFEVYKNGVLQNPLMYLQ